MSRRSPIQRILSWQVPRRTVVQGARVAVVGAAAAALGLYGREASAERIAHGTCRICTMHCGLVAHSKGGRLVRVEGDPESNTRGFICHHGWALREIVHSTDRIRRPLERREDAFVEVPWERAYERIAARLQDVQQKWGPQSVAVLTGWPFVRHPMVHMLQRFCAALGTPNLATVASLCEASARMGRALVTGANVEPDLRGAKTLLVWGANPAFTSPPFGHLVAQFADPGRALLVVDPIRTETAARATVHLQPLPGTDGAVALGMLNVILSEGLASGVAPLHGLDELRALAARYPPERVQGLTTVPAEALVKAARLFAQHGPGAIWEGLGVEHHDNGVQTVRAINALSAVCGYVDEPGGSKLLRRVSPGFFDRPLPQLYRMTTPEPVPPPIAAQPIGYDEYPLYEVFNRQAQGMLFERAILEDRPYPLRALIVLGANPVTTHPGAERTRAAYDKLELLVTVDPFLTDTGQRSNFVLPACTFAEAPAVEAGDDDAKVARSGLVDEQFEARPDWRIVFELARAAGKGEYFPWQSFQEAVDAPRVPWMQDDAHQPKPLPQDTLPRYPTTTGKLELHSPLLERFGYDPLPEWTPPRHLPTLEYPLVLVTGPRTRPYINSQFRQIRTIADKAPEPLVQLHPSLGVADGAQVWIVSPHGRLQLRAHVTERVHPQTVVVPAGWARANANVLTDPEARDPISGFPAFRSLTCRIEPA